MSELILVTYMFGVLGQSVFNGTFGINMSHENCSMDGNPGDLAGNPGNLTGSGSAMDGNPGDLAGSESTMPLGPILCGSCGKV